MMRQMRENTKWIMLVTACAFVLLMVLQWGMDATGRTSGSPGEIGRVNGTRVLYDDYMAVYRSLYERVQSQQQEPISTQQNKEIEQAAWDQMVDRILIKDELDRRGIDVSDEEIRQAALFQPPGEFRDNPAFLTDGAFNLAKYQQYLSTSLDPQLFLQLEAFYRDVLPRGKLMRQVATGIYLSDTELWERFRDTQERVEVRFVPFNPAVRIPNDSVTVTNAEIERYWRDNQDAFAVPARASVKAIVLPRTPTAADSAAAQLRATALLGEIVAGTSFDTVGAREAAAQRPVVFEDLGTFSRDQLTPAFDTAAFTAPVGRPTGPVATSFGYHLLLVSNRTADSATAKHILVPVTRTEASDDSILMIADSLENLVDNRTLEEAARMMGLEVRTEQLTDVLPFISGAGQVGDGADWVFEEGAPGEVSELFENNQAFYVFELVSTEPGGVRPLIDAQPTIRQILLLEKKIEKAKTQAQRLVERVRSGTTLENAAAEMGLDVRAPEPFTRQDFVAGMGQQNAAIGAAFGLQPREVSPPVATRDNVFVIQKIAHTPADSLQWEAQKAVQRQQLTSVQQQQRLQRWMLGLRASARIVDRRAEVLTPAAETDAPVRFPPGLGF